MAVDSVNFKLRKGEDFNWANLLKRASVNGNPNLGDSCRVRPGETVEGMQGVIAMRVKDIALRVGISFVRVADVGSVFIYKGRVAKVNRTFELSETVLTIGQALALRDVLQSEGRDRELLSLFTVKGYSFDEVVAMSRAAAAKDVAPEEVDNCPLVFIDGVEAAGLARLLDAQLPSEMQWERAASGTSGLQRPWDTNPAKTTLDKSKAVYDDSGTRPVRSKPATNGIFGLIGNVWEWTQEKVLRGGSWYDLSPDHLRTDFRVVFFNLVFRNGSVGVRLARTIQ